MEEYGEVVADTLSAKDIPYFLDSKKTISDNPFVEYIKASIFGYRGQISHTMQ